MKEEEERLRNIKCWMRLQECGKVTVIPAALGALGTITIGFEKYICHSNWDQYESRTSTKNSLIEYSEDFEIGIIML